MSQHPNADVRMRGFVERVSVDDAIAWLDTQLADRGSLSHEFVALRDATGRVLADDVRSGVNVPILYLNVALTKAGLAQVG